MNIQSCFEQLEWLLDRLSRGEYTIDLSEATAPVRETYDSYYEQEAAKWEIENGRFIRKNGWGLK